MPAVNGVVFSWFKLQLCHEKYLLLFCLTHSLSYAHHRSVFFFFFFLFFEILLLKSVNGSHTRRATEL